MEIKNWNFQSEILSLSSRFVYIYTINESLESCHVYFPLHLDQNVNKNNSHCGTMKCGTKSFSTIIDNNTIAFPPSSFTFLPRFQFDSIRSLLKIWQEVLQFRLHKTLKRSRVQQPLPRVPLLCLIVRGSRWVWLLPRFNIFVFFKNLSSVVSFVVNARFKY